MRRFAGWGLAAAAVALLGAGPATAQFGGTADEASPAVHRAQGTTDDPPVATTDYHGFRIEIADPGGVDPRRMMAAAEHQIDIVDRAGLDPAMMDVMRHVPVRVSGTFFKGGHYGGGPVVDLSPMSATDDRPVLLHEYMHVLEWKTFPQRFRNPTVQRYFEEAREGGIYPADSYMMSAPWEFFAMTASCYLNGELAREPFTRQEIRERQPDLYAYLEGLFGPRG